MAGFKLYCVQVYSLMEDDILKKWLDLNYNVYCVMAGFKEQRRLRVQVYSQVGFNVSE